MLVDEIRAEQLAEVFHRYHQTLHENWQSITDAAAESWNELPGPERDRMIAAARLTLLELDSETDRRKYFAKPGEAEWGC
jgi:phage-related minor tail protein